MPLSDHEQRLLDQIEQALYADDPKFASAVRSARGRWRTRRALVLAVFGVLAGLALVLIGLITTIIVISVVGFVLLVGSCALGVHAVRGRVAASAETPESSGSRTARPSGLRTRMEERMRRRFDEQ
jgi:Protein of unknown function (DUF3040)